MSHKIGEKEEWDDLVGASWCSCPDKAKLPKPVAPPKLVVNPVCIWHVFRSYFLPYS